jgi:DNA recombination protein RmuC
MMILFGAVGGLCLLGIGIFIGMVIGASRERVRATTDQGEKVRLDESLRGITEKMETLAKQTHDAELRRAEAEGAVRTQIENMRLGNESLLRETTKLAGALSNSQTRGKYGETQLEMLLEDAGLLEGIHFVKQDYRSSGGEISKPDIKIAIPGGSEIFIDSKFPFDRFLEAITEKDPEMRREKMAYHAKDLYAHVTALAKRGYSEGSTSPDFVVLFVPFESILSEALDVDPLLLHKSFEKKIALATPTTMMALLRTVAYVFSQSKMAENAATIKDLATDLVKRIGKVHEKIETLGERIKSSERAFNDLVASSEENMLRPAKKMMALGVPSSKKLTQSREIASEVRAIKRGDLRGTSEDVDIDFETDVGMDDVDDEG